jgi:hypothetical protein
MRLQICWIPACAGMSEEEKWLLRSGGIWKAVQSLQQG